MSDAQERLRRYLEQRRELGESEFVLDALSVEDALRVIGSRGGAAGAAGGGATGAAGSAAAGRMPPAPEGPRHVGDPLPPPPSDSAIRKRAEEAAKGGDWREALRAVDAGTAPAAKRPPAGEPLVRVGAPAVPPDANTAVDPAPGAPPAGSPIVVGAGAARSEFTDLGSIADVARAVAACTRCELHAAARNPVPGEGDPSARFVVVGEAPGATEDELGRPFVGRSGELLNKILEAIGFKREQVFICNVLKHRPPGNRNPAAGEIVACRPYLLRQLELLQPRVILALGTFAAQTLLETDVPIGKLRGLEHTYHGIPLVATYHPAALLRNPSWKRPAWEDVQLARRIFDRA